MRLSYLTPEAAGASKINDLGTLLLFKKGLYQIQSAEDLWGYPVQKCKKKIFESRVCTPHIEHQKGKEAQQRGRCAQVPPLHQLEAGVVDESYG